MGEHLTRGQHAQLAAELSELEGPRRKEIVEAIAVARGHGDLSENFEYHAAKNEQGLLEREITILRARLEDAEIVEGGDPDLVAVGSRVVVEDETGSRIEVEISGLGGNGTTSPSSPLGAALLGEAGRRDRRRPGAQEHLAGDRRLDRLAVDDPVDARQVVAVAADPVVVDRRPWTVGRVAVLERRVGRESKDRPGRPVAPADEADVGAGQRVPGSRPVPSRVTDGPNCAYA